MEHCGHEDDFKLIKKELFGNGRPGLSSTVSALEQRVSNMEDDMTEVKASLKSINADVKVLVQFQIQQQTRDELKEQERERHFKNLKIFIALAGLVITGIALFL